MINCNYNSSLLDYLKSLINVYVGILYAGGKEDQQRATELLELELQVVVQSDTEARN